MKHRIYKVKSSGEVVVDTPSNKYQGDNFEDCPHPWRFRDSNPDKEEFELEILTTEEVQNLAEDKNEAGSAQFYYDTSGKLKHDHTWDELIMPEDIILQKHKKQLELELDEELGKPQPDPVRVVKKDREMKKLSKLSSDEALELALSKLEAENKKPKIQAKLRKKLGKTS